MFPYSEYLVFACNCSQVDVLVFAHQWVCLYLLTVGVLVFTHSECLVFVYLLAFAHQWVADRAIPGVLDGAVEEGGSLALDRDVRRHISKHRNLFTVPGNADAITLSTS